MTSEHTTKRYGDETSKKHTTKRYGDKTNKYTAKRCRDKTNNSPYNDLFQDNLDKPALKR